MKEPDFEPGVAPKRRSGLLQLAKARLVWTLILGLLLVFIAREFHRAHAVMSHGSPLHTTTPHPAADAAPRAVTAPVKATGDRR